MRAHGPLGIYELLDIVAEPVIARAEHAAQRGNGAPIVGLADAQWVRQLAVSHTGGAWKHAKNVAGADRCWAQAGETTRGREPKPGGREGRREGKRGQRETA